MAENELQIYRPQLSSICRLPSVLFQFLISLSFFMPYFLPFIKYSINPLRNMHQEKDSRFHFLLQLSCYNVYLALNCYPHILRLLCLICITTIDLFQMRAPSHFFLCRSKNAVLLLTRRGDLSNRSYI